MQPVIVVSLGGLAAEFWSLSFGNGIYHVLGWFNPSSAIDHEPSSGPGRQDGVLFLTLGLWFR
jgi:hypothetical protein